ncbi:MAG TPA: tripartite tricarboxylate transporter substrate-binding protein [Crenalkalicoccus sp.]|jgi:tripartite-type tricarboxylate transporter receptor subunit TctC|nr:tripartite tricarboxylate transporter substrate-binding protein [Crenalkalicoccus sp.]
MTSRRALLGAAAALPALAARAQAPWPNGPVRIIAPFPPGGSVDTIARLLQPFLQQRLGQPIVVENRTGAAGAIGAQAAARAAPDGNTWVVVFDSYATHAALIPNLGFDPKRDLQPVMLVGTSPMVVCTPNARPWRSVAEVVATAKAKPDTLTYGTIGNGSLGHLTMELAQQAAGFRVAHVPYRGGGPLSAAAAAGEVDLVIATRAGLAGQVGVSLRALAQTGAERSPSLPELPTLAEAGIPGVAATAFWGVLAPAGVPAPVVAKMHAALVAALAEPVVKQRLAEGQGVDIQASSPEAFGRFLTAQMDQWGRVVKERDIRAD